MADRKVVEKTPQAPDQEALELWEAWFENSKTEAVVQVEQLLTEGPLVPELEKYREYLATDSEPRVISGQSYHRQLGIGEVVHWKPWRIEPRKELESVDPELVGAEVEKFIRAADVVLQFFTEIGRKMESGVGDGSAKIVEEVPTVILSSLQAESGKYSVSQVIRENSCTAASACDQMLVHLIARQKINLNPAAASKALDYEDLRNHLQLALAGRPIAPDLSYLPDKSLVVVAQELTPSELACLLDPDVPGKVEAIVIGEVGAATDHIEIVSKEVNIPALRAINDPLSIPEGALAIVDATGENARCIISPDQATLSMFLERVKSKDFGTHETDLHHRDPFTSDGREIILRGAASSMAVIDNIKKSGLKGCGLIRTETLLSGMERLRSEDEQEQLLVRAIRRNPGLNTVRTFDFGTDKPPPRAVIDRYPDLFHAGRDSKFDPIHDSLALRGLRLSLLIEPEFRAHLRAIIRAAGSTGRIRVMFPMVETEAEFAQAREMFSREKDFLMARNLFATRPQIEVGAMIETPRAVDNARWIANRANWLSIGLRDLTERTLGLNPRATGAAVVLDSCDPSVIRMVSAVVRAAEQASQEKGVVVPVSVCGVRAVESQDKDSHDAAIIDAETFILLIGLGVQDFSLDPRIAGNANYILSKVDFSRAKTLADKILQMPGGMPSKVRAMVRDSFPEAFS